MLSRLSFEEQVRELSLCRDFFESELGNKEHFLAFPFGVPGTWNHDTVNAMGKCGLSASFTVGRKNLMSNNYDKRWEIPRFDVNDVFHEQDRLCLDFESRIK